MKKTKTKRGLKWHTFEDTFSKVLRSKKLKKAYGEEVARLRLAQEVRKLRLERKMTQESVANKVNVPQSVIARLESGTHSVSVDTLSRVAHALGKKVTIA